MGLKIRTYFWHDRVISKTEYAIRKFVSPSKANIFFKNGNAGDLITSEILKMEYKISPVNIKNGNNRLLCTGSIAHKISKGDFICGIGAKTDLIPLAAGTDCLCWGLRGPISFEIFKKAGYDLSNIQFLGDPGLLIKKLVPQTPFSFQRGKVIFIPHYRERILFAQKNTPSIEIVDIDDAPMNLAEKIANAEIVLSSSLHGIVFAHALGKQCQFILPQTKEPLLKYYDYFVSIDISDPRPIKNYTDFNAFKSISIPKNIDSKIDCIKFPSFDELKRRGIIK